MLISVQNVLIIHTNTKENIKYLLRVRYTVVMHEYRNRWTVQHSYIFRQFLLLSKTCFMFQLFIRHNSTMYLVSYNKR
jgi:hypothetical protein